LGKTVENAAAVELRCLRISAQSVNISQVWIRILTTVKNAEYVESTRINHSTVRCVMSAWTNVLKENISAERILGTMNVVSAWRMHSVVARSYRVRIKYIGNAPSL